MYHVIRVWVHIRIIYCPCLYDTIYIIMLCRRRCPGNYSNLQLAGGRRWRWVGAGAPDDDAHVKQKPSAHWSRRRGRGGTRRLSRSPRAGRVRVRRRRRRVPVRVAAENEFVSIRSPRGWVDGK